MPLDVCDYSGDWRGAENYKTESLSSRSSSPKSLTESSESWTSSPLSISEASESPEGSIISETENEADRIANDLDNMKITEIQAEEMMKEGADMRHVLKAAYQLKPKCISKMKFKKGTKLNGRAVLSLLNFDKYKEKDEEDEQKQRMSRAWAEYEQRLNRGKGVKPPPGFENLDQVIAKKISDEVEEPEFLVSYANGTNTLTLASQPIVVHDVTVSCVVDSCRVFIQHMKNPTFEGLKNLENELLTTYSMEPAKDLLRPIAQGSVLGVFSDSKWYRCQVVSYNTKQDTCDVKFVDHGGYTTVPASHLRQLKSEFLRLPFQSIEVYLAHVNPSTSEMQTDITSEILFHANVSIRLLGQADDGVPMIQAYYYDGDYINIFTQDIINSCNLNQQLTRDNSTPCESPSSSEAASLEDFPALPTHEDFTVTPEEFTTQEDYPGHEEFSPSPEAAEAYTGYPYPTYPYFCPEMGYVQAPVEPSQPTLAYCYQDAQGLQQIYYVAGPFIMPTQEPSPLPVTEDSPSSSPPSEESSELSFGWSNEVETENSEESSTASEEEHVEVDLDNKPAEEWTQEDYARYYGL